MQNKIKSPPLGSLVYVAEETRPYRVHARDERYAVCTKSHFGTVLYFVLDTEAKIRGTENLIFGLGAETDEQCREMLARIQTGQTEVSHRNRVELDVVRVG